MTGTVRVPVRCYLALGVNLGDRLANLQAAVDLLGALDGIRVRRSSRVYETAPVGGPAAQPDYLNAVVEIETTLPPRELLGACGAVEAELGRERAERWGPRTIDVDVLTYGREEIDEPGLTVPHPRMHQRAFVLAPLLELDADPPLPGRRRIATLRADLGDLASVRPFAPPLQVRRARVVAVVGAGRAGTAVAVLLARAGHQVVAVAGREATRERAARWLPGVPFLSPAEAAARSAAAGGVVVLGAPDDRIAEVCAAVAPAVGPGVAVLHLSGSAGLDLLDPAAARGATVLSLHPLQSFPDVETGVERLPGSGIGVTARTEEAAALGEALARELGGIPFRLAEDVKPLYHAAAVFASNYLVTVEAIAEELFRAAGLRQPAALMEPLARTAFDRTFAAGPEAALTGPAARGDAGTLVRNLAALAELAPDAAPAYAALARAAAGIAARAGRLSPEGRAAVEEALVRWSS